MGENIEKKIDINKEKLNTTKLIAKQLLKNMGMKLNCLGFIYWFEAVCMSVDIEIHNREQPKITQVYFLIARKFKSNVNNVRKAMSYAYADLDLKKYFNVPSKINNTALLILMKDYVLKELNNPETKK